MLCSRLCRCRGGDERVLVLIVDGVCVGYFSVSEMSSAISARAVDLYGNVKYLKLQLEGNTGE